MDDDEIGQMADDFAAWVLMGAAFIRSRVEIGPDGMPDLPKAVAHQVREQVWALSPDACRYALVAALIKIAAELEARNA